MDKIININAGAMYVDRIDNQTVNNFNAPVNNFNAPVNNYSAPAGNHPATAVTFRAVSADVPPSGADVTPDPPLEIVEEPALTPDDERVKAVLEQMKRERVLLHSYDYAWVMELFRKADEHRLPHRFYSAASFVRYITDDLGIAGAPCASSLTRKLSVVYGTFPEWTFVDDPDGREVKRRVNVGRRFLSLFRKGV